MRLLYGLLQPFQLWNDVILKIGRGIAVVAIALMVVAILIQVFFRYVLNNALPWPDEAARFLMLWLTGLIAPTGYRRGGFVAIDMVSMLMPPRAAALLALFLLVISGIVLYFAILIGWSEVTGFGGNFATSSLWVPWIDGWMKVPRSWMMSSLLVGVFLLWTVNVEFILRSLITFLGGADMLRPIPQAAGDMAVE